MRGEGEGGEGGDTSIRSTVHILIVYWQTNNHHNCTVSTVIIFIDPVGVVTYPAELLTNGRRVQ